jgi:hypothetical protein
MPTRGANGSRWPGRNGADIDHQADRRDQIEAAVTWIQARQALFKRIAALQARIGRVRVRTNGKARTNGKTQAPRVRTAETLTAAKRNR